MPQANTFDNEPKLAVKKAAWVFKQYPNQGQNAAPWKFTTLYDV